jgi:hypothetical protein
MEIIEDVLFVGGQDSNGGPLDAAKNTCRRADNLIIVPTQAGGDTLFAKSPKGNVLLNNPSLPAGTYIAHGFKYDSKYRYIYYALTRPRVPGVVEKTCYWWRYSVQGGHELVLESVKLNFLSNSFTSIEIVDGNILYWIDPKFVSWLQDIYGNQQFGNPKRLLIDKALAYTQSGGTSPLGYPQIDDCCLDQCKWPPFYPPKAFFSSNPNKSISLIRDKSYQFAYRYIYDAYEISKPSGASDLCFAVNSQTLSGTIYSNPYLDNEVTVILNTGNHSVNVIDVLVREGNTGNWFLFKKIDKKALGLTNDAPYTVKYDGTAPLLAIPQEQLFSFDLVPDVSYSMKFSPTTKTLLHLNIQEGYNKAPYTKNSINLIRSLYKPRQIPAIQAGITIVSPDPLINYARYRFLFASYFKSGDVIVFSLVPGYSDTDYNLPTIYFNYTITQADISSGTEDQIAQRIISNILAAYPNPTVRNGYQISLSSFSSAGQNYIFAFVANGSGVAVPVAAVAANVDASLLLTRTLKNFDTHDFTVTYYRQGNKTPGATYDKLKISNFFNPAVFPDIFGADQLAVTRALIYLGETPPEEATHYSIAKRERNVTADFVQIAVLSVQTLSKQVKVFLNTWYTDNYPGSSYNYTIAKGDIVTLLTYMEVVYSGTSVVSVTQKWASQFVQATVVDYDAVENSITVTGVDVSQFQLRAGSIIQIAKGNPANDEAPYYSTSKFYEILDPNTPNRRHGGESFSLQIYAISITDNGFYVKDNFSFMSARTITTAGTTSNNRTGLCIATYDPSTNLTKFSFPGFPVVGPENLTPTTATVNAKLDQTTAPLPAICYYDRGDVWMKVRPNYSSGQADPQGNLLPPFSQTVESNFFSDYWDSRGWDKGFAFALDLNAKQVTRTNLVRSSQSIVAGTQTNGLSEFLVGESQEVSANHGPIVASAVRGEALRVYQTKEISTIVLGRSIPTNPDLSEQYILTNTKLGPVTPSRQGYGGWKEQSTLQLDTDVFVWDVINGVFIKDTIGGVFDVGKAMHIDIQAICKKIALGEQNGNPYDIRMGYNPITKELITSFRNQDATDVFTLSYLPDAQIWNGYQNYFAEAYGNLNNSMLAISKGTGKVYEMNVGATNVFFENALAPSIRFYAREALGEEKVLRSMFIRCLSQPVKVSVFAQGTTQSPLGQETICKIQKVEDGYLCVLYSNKLDPNFATPAQALAMGRQMRSTYFEVKIDWQSGALVNLKNVTLYYDVDRPTSH